MQIGLIQSWCHWDSGPVRRVQIGTSFSKSHLRLARLHAAERRLMLLPP
jgi:hypothetical protein